MQSKIKKLKKFNIFFGKPKIFPPDIEKHFENFHVPRLGQGLPCTEVFGPSLEPLFRLARIILSVTAFGAEK